MDAAAFAAKWKEVYESVTAREARKTDYHSHGHNATSHKSHTHAYKDNLAPHLINAPAIAHIDALNYGKLNAQDRMVKAYTGQPLMLHNIPQPIRTPTKVKHRPTANWTAFYSTYINSTAHTKFDTSLTLHTQKTKRDYYK